MAHEAHVAGEEATGHVGLDSRKGLERGGGVAPSGSCVGVAVMWGSRQMHGWLSQSGQKTLLAQTR